MKKFIFYLAFFFILLLAFLFIFSKNKESIKIGVFVTITGIYPDLGREIRDGALLAVEIINERGGANGRPLQLIIKDNKYNIEIAKMNYEELYKEKVVAVIGPATSTTAKNILPLINEKKLLTIAPTPTSTELAGLDDYMIRLRPTNREDAEVLAEYLKKNLKIKKIAIIYDVINPSYTRDFIDNFKPHLSKETKLLLYPFDEKVKNFNKFSKTILNQSPDAVLLLIDVYNASLFIQNLRILKPDLLILTTIWAKSPSLIEYSGKWAEGVLTVDVVDCCRDDDFSKYVNKRYLEKYGRTMSYAAINGFDSVMIIKKALENGANRENMKEYILKIKRFEGLQGEITFDEFGDRQKRPFIMRITEGKFKRVTQWK